MTVSPKWPIYMSSTLSDMCFYKNRIATNKRPSCRPPGDAAGPPRSPFPECLCRVVTEGLNGEGLNWSVGVGFQKIMPLFSIQDLNFIEGAAAVVGTGINDLI